jgi:3-oxoacyl-[acyl-carrier protein] reductase
VTDIDAVGAEETARAIQSAGGKAHAFEHDVAQRASWEALVDRVLAVAGRIDALVNNAGITRDRTVARMTDGEWQAVLDVNLTGVWLGCQSVLESLRKNAGGAIVNISSDSRHGAFGQANYAAAKAGVVGLTRTVAMEEARHGIRCNAIAPGAILTRMTEMVPDPVRESWLEDIPLGRMGEPAEIAAAVAFLVSPDASYVTGHVLCVDGGSSH